MKLLKLETEKTRAENGKFCGISGKQRALELR